MNSRHDQTPRKHDDGDPSRGPHQLEDNVAGDLEESVRHEEERDGSVILQAMHVQVLCQTRNFRIANCTSLIKRWSERVGRGKLTVTPVDKGDKIK